MPAQLTRRSFIAAAASGFSIPLLTRVPAARAAPAVTLVTQRRTLDVNGKAATVFGIMQPDGSHGLVTEVGSRFRVHLQNAAGADTLIHWHGLTPPYQQDGVPGISAPALQPGGSAQYDFPLTVAGTYWMHSHQGLQEQSLMSAPLIIHDRPGVGEQQEIVLMLHDFSFKGPDEIYAGLRRATSSAPGRAMDRMSSMAGNHMQGMAMRPAAPTQRGMAGTEPVMPGMEHGGMPRMTAGSMSGMGHGDMHGMKMGQNGDAGPAGMAMDLNDVVYDAFLANDRTLADPEVVRVEPGGRVLLRIINGSAASNFQVALGQTVAELVAVDGHPVQPMAGSIFPIAIAQRLDLEIQLPPGQAVLPILAVLEGERQRTGIVLATARGQVRKLAPLAPKAAAPLNFQVEETLRAAVSLAPKPADRVHHIDLTGSMQEYVWGLNGLTYGHDKPLMVSKGQRVELVMANRTMMSHPMHLHGHFFQVVAVNGRRFAGAMRDTVLVPPMMSVTIAFDADNPGKWAFHCHNLYHMEAGMMTTVRYENF